MNNFSSVSYLKFLLILLLQFQQQNIVSKNYITRNEFDKVLKERDNDISLNDSLKVFDISHLYCAAVDNEEIVVYNYYKNNNVIQNNYIWETTTNNHWIQLVLRKDESKLLEISCYGEHNISQSNTKIVGMDDVPILFQNNKLIIKIKGGMTRRGMVIINGNESEPLFVFIDEPIDFIMTDSTVVFEGYNKGTYIVPLSINKIHIPLGSYYRGNIISNHDIEVSGMGIISQEGIKHTGYEKREDNPIKCNVSVRGDKTRMKIKGITSIEPAMYHFWVWPGYGTVYENVKSFSFLYETDAYIGTRIIDCFSKVNDDHIKLYISNMQVERFYTYLQGNGHSFQFGWGNYGSRKNIQVKDVIVYRDLNNLSECKYVRSFINWRKPDFPNIIEDVVFDSIKFYGSVKSFLVIDNDNNPWKSKPIIRNFFIKNVLFTQKPYCKMKLENPSFNIKIENFRLMNDKITEENINDFISEKSFGTFHVQ